MPTDVSPTDRWPRLRLAGLIIVFVWFAVGGVAHFVATDAEIAIVPPFVPWPRAAVLVSGVLELLGAAALLWRPTRRAGGLLLIVVTIGVTPVHFWMLETAERWPVPLWALVLRLPLQALLIALIAWSTAPVWPDGSALRKHR